MLEVDNNLCIRKKREKGRSGSKSHHHVQSAHPLESSTRAQSGPRAECNKCHASQMRILISRGHSALATRKQDGKN